MQTMKVAELKTHFSDVLKTVRNDGEKIIIEYGKKHEKVAMIIPYDSSYEIEEKREFGLFKGKGNFKIKDDFEITDEELLGYE